MKTKLLALVLLVSANAANSAYISFSPASVSIPRGGVSAEITIRVSGDSTALPFGARAAAVETRLTIPLTQMDFVEMVPGGGISSCIISAGKLSVAILSVNLTPLTVAVNSMCKFRLRARNASTPGIYSMTQSDFYSYNYVGDELQNVISVQNATVNITP